MVDRVAPFLMFEGRAEEALAHYAEAFPGSRVEIIERYGAGSSGIPGSIKRASIDIAGLNVMVTDSPISHGFTFTPSMSLFVTCKSEAELRQIAASLGAGGKVLMPIGDYGFSRLFTWLSDRFGVSWQLNLA